MQFTFDYTDNNLQVMQIFQYICQNDYCQSLSINILEGKKLITVVIGHWSLALLQMT